MKKTLLNIKTSSQPLIYESLSVDYHYTHTHTISMTFIGYFSNSLGSPGSPDSSIQI